MEGGAIKVYRYGVNTYNGYIAIIGHTVQNPISGDCCLFWIMSNYGRHSRNDNSGGGGNRSGSGGSNTVISGSGTISSGGNGSSCGTSWH